MLSLPLHAGQQDPGAANTENEFLDVDLATLLTLKIDPNLASLLDSHIHRAGERMLSYRYMIMDMDVNRSGSNEVTTDEVLGSFMVAPTSMSMEMHMISTMYAPTDQLTLMMMLPYLQLSMDHVTRTTQRFTTRTSGIGDLGIAANYLLTGSGPHRFIFHGGVMLPTGSIDERGDTPAGTGQKLPYPMQLGSGTYDLVPGLAYQGVTERWSWGAEVKSVVRLGENRNHYRLGNQLILSTWLARAWTPRISNLLKLENHTWGNIQGADPELDPNIVPTADPKLRGGRHVDLHIGTEFYQPEGTLAGLRLSLDFELPLYDSLDGPQLATAWSLTGTLQWTF